MFTRFSDNMYFLEKIGNGRKVHTAFLRNTEAQRYSSMQLPPESSSLHINPEKGWRSTLRIGKHSGHVWSGSKMGGSRDTRETLGGSHLSGGLAVSRRNDSLMCFKQYSRGVENPVGGAGVGF